MDLHSGKTRRARELQAWLEADGRTVHLINDEALGIDRRVAYAGACTCAGAHARQGGVALSHGYVSTRVHTR